MIALIVSGFIYLSLSACLLLILLAPRQFLFCSDCLKNLLYDRLSQTMTDAYTIGIMKMKYA